MYYARVEVPRWPLNQLFIISEFQKLSNQRLSLGIIFKHYIYPTIINTYVYKPQCSEYHIGIKRTHSVERHEDSSTFRWNGANCGGVASDSWRWWGCTCKNPLPVLSYLRSCHLHRCSAAQHDVVQYLTTQKYFLISCGVCPSPQSHQASP